MTLFATVEPVGEPVTLAQVKAYIRVDHDGEDELILSLMRAARAAVEKQAGLALMDQHWRLTLERIPRGNPLTLAPYPVKQITAVKGYDRDGNPHSIDMATVFANLHERPATLRFDSIDTAHIENGIEVDFICGFGESGADVPDGLKRAILMLIGFWYELRAGFGPKDQPVAWPHGFERQLQPYRDVRL